MGWFCSCVEQTVKGLECATAEYNVCIPASLDPTALTWWQAVYSVRILTQSRTLQIPSSPTQTSCLNFPFFFIFFKVLPLFCFSFVLLLTDLFGNQRFKPIFFFFSMLSNFSSSFGALGCLLVPQVFYRFLKVSCREGQSRTQQLVPGLDKHTAQYRHKYNLLSQPIECLATMKLAEIQLRNH